MVSSNAAITVRTSSIGVMALARSCDVRQSRSISSPQPAPRLRLLRGTAPVVVQRGHQVADPAQRGGHGPAPRLGGVGGEDRVHAQPGQQVAEVPGTLLVAEFSDRGGE